MLRYHGKVFFLFIPWLVFVLFWKKKGRWIIKSFFLSCLELFSFFFCSVVNIQITSSGFFLFFYSNWKQENNLHLKGKSRKLNLKPRPASPLRCLFCLFFFFVLFSCVKDRDGRRRKGPVSSFLLSPPPPPPHSLLPSLSSPPLPPLPQAVPT